MFLSGTKSCSSDLPITNGIEKCISKPRMLESSQCWWKKNLTEKPISPSRNARKFCFIKAPVYESEDISDVSCNEQFLHEEQWPSFQRSSQANYSLTKKSIICSRCSNNSDETTGQTSFGNQIAFYRISRDAGKPCMVQESDGQYRQKTVYLVPTKMASNHQKPNPGLHLSRNANFLLKKYETTSSLTRNQQRFTTLGQLNHKNAVTSNILAKRFGPNYVPSYPCPRCMYVSHQNAPNISVTLPMLHCASIDQQIDPEITSFDSSQVQRSTRTENIRRKPLSKFFSTARKFFFSNSSHHWNLQPSDRNFSKRLRTAFQKTIDGRQSSSSFSSLTTVKQSKMFCWTCFEMDGEDETLSSVDSGKLN